MFKKMLMSMIFMTVLIVGGLLFYFNSTTEGLFGKTDSSSRGMLPNTFENDTYMYYLTDSQIQKAIKTSTTTVDLIENFLLEDEKQGNRSATAFAYVETPYLTVVKEARKLYDYTGRRPVLEDVKPNLMDQYLPVHVRFHGNKAYIYDVEIGQGGDSIQPYKIDNTRGGTAKTIYLDVGKLDFSQPLTINAVDRVDSSQVDVFSLDFDKYTP
jgi:hypothetical protein